MSQASQRAPICPTKQVLFVSPCKQLDYLLMHSTIISEDTFALQNPSLTII